MAVRRCSESPYTMIELDGNCFCIQAIPFTSEILSTGHTLFTLLICN